MQEVSSVRSTQSKKDWGRNKLKLLKPDYLVGFVDGEGCFCVSISKHKTLKSRIEIRPEFEIELRADDCLILERIQATLKCGKIYSLDYKKYGWKPHVKYKVSNIRDLEGKVIPFFLQYPLQAKKEKVFKIFCSIVKIVAAKQHLNKRGIRKIIKLRDQIRVSNK